MGDVPDTVVGAGATVVSSARGCEGVIGASVGAVEPVVVML